MVPLKMASSPSIHLSCGHSWGSTAQRSSSCTPSDNFHSQRITFLESFCDTAVQQRSCCAFGISGPGGALHGKRGVREQDIDRCRDGFTVHVLGHVEHVAQGHAAGDFGPVHHEGVPWYVVPFQQVAWLGVCRVCGELVERL